MGTLTMKFGGSSVGTTPALTQVVSIVLQEHERWDRLLVVVSALEGVTDALIEATHLAQLSNRRGYRRIVATIRNRHMALVDKLPLGANERSALHADIDKLLFDMLGLCQEIADSMTEQVAPEQIDAIVGVGEKIAARVVAALLRQNGLRGVALDATELLVTDNNFGNAEPNLVETRRRVEQNLFPMLERKIIPVITGFIGGTITGQPTTLGRGGSDYTASILAVCVKATEVWIWTDVDGMMSADPREISEARVVPELSYGEVAELAYFGARVLHSRMIAPLQGESIPVRVKNVFKPQQNGTLIYNMAGSPTEQRIKAVTAIQGIGLSADRSGPLSEIAALVSQTLHDTVGTSADVMITAQSSTRSLISFVIPTVAGPDAVHTMHSSLERTLKERNLHEVWKVKPVSIVTVIGAGLSQSPQLMARIFATLSTVPILAISQGPAQCNLSLVIDPAFTDDALRLLHPLTLGVTSNG
ncbi:MAG: aspartate kinase [Anaerolineae bacterium]